MKKKPTKKKAKRHLNPIFYKILLFILIVTTVVSFSYIIIEEIFSLYGLIPFMIAAVVFIIIVTIVMNSKLRRWVKNIFSLLSIIVIAIELLFSIYGAQAFNLLNNITDTGYRVETFGVYVNAGSSFIRRRCPA